MKTVLITVLIAFAFNAQAGLGILTKYNYGTQSSEGTSKEVQATVTQDGELTIHVLPLLNPLNSDLVKPVVETVTVDISDASLEILSNKVASLVDQEIYEEQNALICLTFVAIEDFRRKDHLYTNRAYDTLENDFVGPLELVQGPQGCWVSHKVYPVNGWANQQASEMKSTMRILVNEYAGHLL